jgi:O-antigen ligase
MKTVRLFFRQRVWQLGATLAALAVALGAVAGYGGPLMATGALVALAAGGWALTSVEVSLWGAVAIIALLPFASLPFKIVFTPTFLDLALLSVLSVYLLQWMLGHRRRLTLTPAHAPIAAFMVLAVFSFVAGKDNGPLTSNLLRQFGELLLNISLVYILVDQLRDFEQLNRLARALILGGGAAALIGLVLYALPTDVAERLLSALRPFGYPAGGVLRFIEDNPDNAQRAIGTSVDPNVLGGLLAITGGLLGPQLFAPRPVLRFHWLTWGALGLIVSCLVLTFSRGAMAALAGALLFIALARYRRLLGGVVVGAGLILILPFTRDYLLHFVAGLQGQDLATQMRFGEYKDALILISRYPIFGVGFAGAPDIDIYLGVSSAYLLVTQQMGLVGLAAFLLIIATVHGWAWHRRRWVYANAALTPVWLGAHAGVVAALIVGVVDHYFFELSFQPASALFWIMVSLSLAGTRLADETALAASNPL